MAVNITASPDQNLAQRSVLDAMKRGAKSVCPACGEGPMFRKYLKINDHCPTCQEPLYHHRADDAPAYFTILIVGHIIIGGLLVLELAFAPSIWIHMAIWIPLLLVLSLGLLPIVKGALVGLQWALRMHGFGDGEDDPVQDPALHDTL